MADEKDLAQRVAEMEGRLRDVELSLANRLTAIEGKVDALLEKVLDFVTKSRFTPVEVLVYGLVSLIMTSVFAAIIAKVIVK